MVDEWSREVKNLERSEFMELRVKWYIEKNQTNPGLQFHCKKLTTLSLFERVKD